jgi:methionyl-tRNA formyltransferase
LKVAFVGAVEGSAIALDALNRAGMAPGLVITLSPEVASRHSDYVDLTPLAMAGNSDVLYVTNINGPATIEALRAFKTDLSLVIGWSQICGDAFRSVAEIGNVGFHPAPLPRMRGRAVIPWTILLGERTTAASLFWLDDGVDSGPILLQESIELSEDETARSLYVKQTEALARMLPRAVALVEAGNAPRFEQNHDLATYCAKRTPDDGLISWTDPAEAILRLIRAVGDPYPGAFTTAGGRKLTIDQASLFAESNRYIGLPGQVQSHTSEGFVVRCGDGRCIHVTSWRHEPNGKPRIHSKLGTGVA